MTKIDIYSYNVIRIILFERGNDMRFYGGYGKEGLAPGRQRPEDNTGKAVQGEKPESKSTKLVIDDTTIYEIDLDCYECRKKNI